MVGLGLVDNTADLSKPISTAAQTALDLKATLESPTFTGTVSGITKSMVGLGLVDNTADLLKPIGTATQTALNLKANASDVTADLATKVDRVTGKELSSNDYTTAEKDKLAAITGTNTGDQTTVSGNAGTATKLAAPKNINGVPFDGSGDITIPADLTTNITGALPTANLADEAVTTAKLANNAVDLTTKVTGALPTANLADGAVTTAKLANNAVDLTTKVTGTLASSNLADGSVTTSKLADAAVTTSKIANTAVDLSTKVTGSLPVANGGTGASTATANTIFAGPNGSSGAPAFRSLVAADLPSLTSSYIANTTTAQTANFNISGSGIIGGTLTVASDSKIEGITVGNGPGNKITNTVFGFEALLANTTGENNASFGNIALMENLSGSGNSAFGNLNLQRNISGGYNTAIGYANLPQNLDGNNNIGLGYNNLTANKSGHNNIGIGYETLGSNQTGSNNIAVGNGALVGSTGDNNISIGKDSGSQLIIGFNNITLGHNAQPSTGTVANEITLGNSSITVLRAKVTSITALSDRRDKADIVTISEGLDFIKQLKPVTFTWNTRDQAKVGIKSAGFIAQDLLALQKSSPIGENLDLVSENNPEKLEARYNNLLPVLVKAIQDQQQVIEDQKTRLDALEKLVQQLIHANGNGSSVGPASEKK